MIEGEDGEGKEGVVDVDGARVREETARRPSDVEGSFGEKGDRDAVDSGQSTISIGTRRRRGVRTELRSRGVVACKHVRLVGFLPG